MSGEPKVHYVASEQEQARTAWNWVDTVVNENASFQDRYATLARKLPGYLQVSGLGQTMAFLYAKSDKENSAEHRLCDQLGEYLGMGTRDQVMGQITRLTPGAYRQCTRKLMQVADWLKRFAEGRLGEGSE